MPDDKEALTLLKNIVDIITPILSDIKTNTGKDNIQTTDDNKVILKEIAKKLKALKASIIDLYQPKPTIQTTLINDKQ